MTRDQFIEHVEGSQAAFRRFLTALCCGDSQLADDIAQESYIKAYLSCDDLADEAKFRAWLFKIGHNTFINHKRGARVLTDYSEARALTSDESADDAFRYQALYSALDRIPAKERTSVLLFYMEGYSIKEIAATVEASEDAVKQHLSRGRKHLRALLSNTL
ncbi:MAG: RNA polymerase sigma factor [Muribaculaceae bacterium]|nr:RNA polymerase sigma factor [Muribaculaceae bacterium]